MSLTDGFLDELRNRLSLAQVAGRKVMWDSRKTNQAKGDFWAPCPFHQEKTASFHVDDRKGFYYCFGCHAKGDAIGFVKDTENVGFMEAVEILAREAGMQMPARDPKAQAKMDRNKQLADVMELATKFFRLQLQTGSASSAREYLNSRGLTQTTQDRFEMGFAPNGRNALSEALSGKGISEEFLVETGMSIKPDDGGAAFDRFRNRIMFPIRDARGRVIAFGGRAMDANQPAKYLNSPETPLFDKGRSLYHHGPAREAAGKANALIVAEGYMDVIALAQAGFDHAVAPLGTAITEDQLALLWRIHPEPIITLDGDKAGLRAAMRLIDLSLPLLDAKKSLRFCILPQNQDPDDVLRAQGAVVMKELLDGALPLVDLLWQRETEGQNFDSPERRAALDARLREAILKIQDKSLRSHYGQAIAQKRRALFAPPEQRGVPMGYRGRFAPKRPTEQARRSVLVQDDAANRLREAIILSAALLNPDAARLDERGLERMPVQTQEFAPILNAILANLHGADADPDSAQLRALVEEQLGYDAFFKFQELKPIATHPYLTPNANPEFVARTLREELVKHAALIGTVQETAEAAEDLAGLADERITERLRQMSEAKTEAMKATEFDATNLGDDEQALRDALQKKLDDEIWIKKKS